jgi:hypothetical protein
MGTKDQFLKKYVLGISSTLLFLFTGSLSPDSTYGVPS